MHSPTSDCHSKEDSTEDSDYNPGGSVQWPVSQHLCIPVSQGNGTQIVKIEPREEGGGSIVSEYLPDLPEEVQRKMPMGKRSNSGCIRKRHEHVTLYLLEADLWHRFKELGTEMIITKKGRRVFPVPSYAICDLDPDKLYNVTLEINAADSAVHKFISGVWTVSKEGSHLYPTPVPGRDTYLHPSSPNTGAHWMREPISFAGLKISNNLEAPGTIVLQSMRKYEMSIIISELSGSLYVRIQQPETQFVAVTQYQNDRVTQMKIEHNPFANGFRFASTKRKENSRKGNYQDQDTEEDSSHEDSSNMERSPEVSPHAQGPSHSGKSHAMSYLPDKVAEYLQEKRSTYKELLPKYLQELKASAEQRRGWNTQDPSNSTVSTYSGWPSGFDQSSYPYPPESLVSFPASNFICAPGSWNPLAQVRRLGEMNRSCNEAAPLSLVKRKRPNPESPTDIGQRRSPRTEQERSPKSKYAYSNNGQHQRSVQYVSEELSEEGQPKLGDAESNALTGQNRGIHTPVKNKFTGSNGKQSGSVIPVWPKEEQLNRNEYTAIANPPSFNVRSPPSPYVRPVVTLENRDLWDTTNEVVVSSEGRPMFPFISLLVSNLEPLKSYCMCLELVPTSRWFYDYIDHEWQPCTEATSNHRSALYQHPNSSKLGQEWRGCVLFDRLRLSTVKQGKNLVKIQARRQYYPVITIRTPETSWRYPLKDAMFITVTIDRTPYLRHGKPQIRLTPSPDNEGRCSDAIMHSSQRKQTNPRSMSTGSSCGTADVDLTSDHRDLGSPQPVELVKTNEPARETALPLHQPHHPEDQFSRPQQDSSRSMLKSTAHTVNFLLTNNETEMSDTETNNGEHALDYSPQKMSPGWAFGSNRITTRTSPTKSEPQSMSSMGSIGNSFLPSSMCVRQEDCETQAMNTYEELTMEGSVTSQWKKKNGSNKSPINKYGNVVMVHNKLG